MKARTVPVVGRGEKSLLFSDAGSELQRLGTKKEREKKYEDNPWDKQEKKKKCYTVYVFLLVTNRNA